MADDAPLAMQSATPPTGSAGSPRITELLDEAALQAVVHDFYDRVFSHPWLSTFFAGVNRTRQERRLVAFIRMVRGAMNPVDGAYLQQAHAHLRITDRAFEVREQLLLQAIRAQGHGQEVADAWRHFDASWRPFIVNAISEPPSC